MHQRFAHVIICLLLFTQGLSGVLGYGLHMGQTEPCCATNLACGLEANSHIHSHGASHDCPFDHETPSAAFSVSTAPAVAEGNSHSSGKAHGECPVCRHLSLLRQVVSATPVVIAETRLEEQLVPVHSQMVAAGTHYRICPRGPPVTA